MTIHYALEVGIEVDVVALLITVDERAKIGRHTDQRHRMDTRLVGERFVDRRRKREVEIGELFARVATGAKACRVGEDVVRVDQ